VPGKTKPVLATAIEVTAEALIVIAETGSRLDSVGKVFRPACPSISPGTESGRTFASGYGIHWALIDEDLAEDKACSGNGN